MNNLILSQEDRVTVDINGIEYTFKPPNVTIAASYEARLGEAKEDTVKVLGIVKDLLKSILCDVKGLKRIDGSEFKLEFVNGEITDKSINALLVPANIIPMCLTIGGVFQSVPVVGEPVKNPSTGEPIPGVIVKKIVCG